MQIGDRVRLQARLYSAGQELDGCLGTVHGLSPKGALVCLEGAGSYFWVTVAPHLLVSEAQDLDQVLALVNR